MSRGLIGDCGGGGGAGGRRRQRNSGCISDTRRGHYHRHYQRQERGGVNGHGGRRIITFKDCYRLMYCWPNKGSCCSLVLCTVLLLLATAIDLTHSNSLSAAAVVATTCEYRAIENVLQPPPQTMSNNTPDVTLRTATKFAEYMHTLSPTAVFAEDDRVVIKRKANQLAAHALKEHQNLLATAIAAPTISVAVVQFRESVVNNVTPQSAEENRNFLSTYWRELGMAWNQSEGTEAWGFPFRDCGLLKHRWLWPYSVTVSLRGHKVVATSFIAADLNPCIDILAEPIYGQRHNCNRKSMVCVPNYYNSNYKNHNNVYMRDVGPQQTPFLMDELYTCLCRQGFYELVAKDEKKPLDVNEQLAVVTHVDRECVACPKHNVSCYNKSMEQFQYHPYHGRDTTLLTDLEMDLNQMSLETLMRATIGAILGTCILSSLGLALLVYRRRKYKSIAMSMWTVLETIILGVILLYCAVLLHFFEASTLRCLLEPWLRELGFVICYGAIILKLYRHLIEFRTRKAHRYVVRDLDLLKYLCAMMVAVLCYLCAFTASSLDFMEHSNLEGLELEHNMCRPLKWDYVTEAGELVILLFGLYLSYVSRNAKTLFQERNFLVASILIEFVVSTNFYIFRALYLPKFNPPILFLSLFVRSQLTNTITLGLIFLPKLLHQYKKGINESALRSGTSGPGIISAADPDIGELTLSEMNPDEIRKELKRLYTQLEILKNKTLRLDNPHISKRRGGRKAHRRFSLQKKSSKDKALHGKHRSQMMHDVEITEAEPSRTPEDSVCSVDGPTEINTK